MRIFVAIDIKSAIRDAISKFEAGMRGFAPDAKWVGPETFHVTLKFIGEKSQQDVEGIKQELRAIQFQPLTISFAGSGFFPNAKGARVFWVGIRAGEELPQLASLVDEATSRIGVPREEHAFKPHLTLARSRNASGAPHQRSRGSSNPFSYLSTKLSELPEPDFGTMTASEFFLYESRLSPKGAQYSKLERFPLRPGTEESAISE